MTIAARERLSLSGRASAACGALKALTGWRRRAASFTAGLAAALALAPLYVLPLMAVGLTVLILLLDGVRAVEDRPLRAGASIGWWFGFGYFLLGLYWMSFAFLVQAEEFAWMAPFAMAGMPAFLALFSAGAGALAMAFWRPGWRRIVAFAIAWVAFEYARGHILTGLPWNLVGQALAGTGAGVQTAALWGAYGLSFVTVLIAAAPAATIERPGRETAGILAALAGAAALFGFGGLRLAATPGGTHADVFVRIVQPNIPQREKIDPAFWARNFHRQLDLSRGVARGDARVFVVWPENAVPVIDEAPDALAEVARALPDNAVLIAGAVRREQDPESAPRYFNSMAIIPNTPAGRRVVLQYDKHHLVPFGEYLPLKGFLRAVGLAQLAPYAEGFTAGPGPVTLNAGGPSFSPLICYEGIFPGEMHPRGDRPEWLLTVTNDAWFGDTSGPRQHLDQARLRSVETGLPMVRAANTGVSAVFDARGVLVERLPLYVEGRIDAPLPKAVKTTLYGRFGDFVLALMMAAGLVSAGLWRK